MDRLKLVLLVFGLIMIEADSIFCEEQSFTIAFMTNVQSSGQCINDLVLYISASETTNCSIYAPKADFYTDVITHDIVEVQIPRSLALIGSGVEQKGIAVSCNTTVTIYGMNACYQNSDGFSVIPNSHLGNEYFAFTVLPSNPGYHSQIAVVSYIDDTTVCIRLPSCDTCEVSIDSDTYTPGSFIHIILNAFESLQIQSMGDLSGTYIYSNNPVAVFSGNDKTYVGNSGHREHLVTQMPSLQSWGKQYVVVPDYPSELLLSFGDTAGRESSLFVMAGTNDTNVIISCTGTTKIITNILIAGNIYQMHLSSSKYCLIETNHPVFVVQATGNDPSLLPLTPIDQYSTNYSFLAPQTSSGSDYQNYFVYVIEDSYLMLDSETIQIEGTTHMKIPGTNLTGGYISLPSRSHKVTHPYANFNGAIFGLTGSESYAISLGWKWKATTDLSTHPLYDTCQMSTTLQTFRFSTAAVTTDDLSTYVSTSTDQILKISTKTKMGTFVQQRPTADILKDTDISTSIDIRETISKSANSTHQSNSTDLISTFSIQSTTDQSTTTNNSSENVTTSQDCNCSCPCTTRITPWTKILQSNITWDELVKLVRDDFEKNIKPNIMINHKNVSRVVRMRTSARNTEVSHRYIGLGISWIVVVPIVFGVVSDLLNFYRYCRGMKGRKTTKTLS